MTTEMQAPPGAPETRERILRAADEQFRRFGPNKTSMEEIASEAGLSRATLYLHFSGKRDLYEALLRRITDDYVARIEQIVESAHSAPKKLRLFVELTQQTYADNPMLVAALAGDPFLSMTKVAAPILAEYRSEILKPLARILRQGIDESTIRRLHVEETAYLMYELGNELLIRELSGAGDFPLQRILAVMDDIVANGILSNKRNQ